MAELPIHRVVSKTGIPQGIEGSNPSLCAKHLRAEGIAFFFCYKQKKQVLVEIVINLKRSFRSGLSCEAVVTKHI